MFAHKNPKKAEAVDTHSADVLAALKKRGWTLRRLALAHGYNGTSLHAALNRDYPKAEQIIANALGVRAKEIWPARYAKRGFKPHLVITSSLRCGSHERRAA